ncbi:4'-phosphopantetheinyl transferase family protein [Streptomyces smyrnaeus]|uniref:4'-phosphopantetheinyl transferase family protein n=1 Tax=Streptomyces TaxID=1883 RepID=UPI001B3853E1|nr:MULTISPECIES: 4'-phosphopantetheinyl transferase superfamily protein [unclassified Streptomyces]MBQ0863923.1 4'-phosphopantetheinyl transferase superfamily protein [Streptomyces sp. RK75]MBQ1120308.1 4'-phosphopantetheinyl transferase superfamily protein [Streptomyces sp. B15]MBQ1157904.1 4'-phosphopantetheinyl transferase superfamily protein [Streptomyces sp. A73]
MTSVVPGIDDPARSPAIHVLRVSEHAAETRASGALAPLSREERERAAAFIRPVDRERYLVAHLALRRELGALLELDPAEVRLTRADCPVCGGPHGRPTVPGDPVHFSLSHAGDVVMLAFAAVPVGVDVEEYPSVASARETMTALHPREQAELAAVEDTTALPAVFARCWTRKEAYLKGTGTGLGEDPSVTYVSALDEPAPVPGWRLTDLPAPAGYSAAGALRQSTTHEAG